MKRGAPERDAAAMMARLLLLYRAEDTQDHAG